MNPEKAVRGLVRVSRGFVGVQSPTGSTQTLKRIRRIWRVFDQAGEQEVEEKIGEIEKLEGVQRKMKEAEKVRIFCLSNVLVG